MKRILTTAAVLMSIQGVTEAPAQAAEGTFEWATYAGAEGTRRYKLFVPPGRDASKPAPLVVMLHGCTQDPEDFARGSRFNDAAAEHGVLVAWPEQPQAAQPMKCWTWYDAAHQGRGGEAAILAAITREVVAKHNADPARVYVAGVSAGGAMAANVAAAYPELFAAAGVHSGIAYRAAANVGEGVALMKQPPEDAKLETLAAALRSALGRERAPRLIVFHGGADAVVVAGNGEALAWQWARALGLRASSIGPTSGGGYDIVQTRWGPDVELWRVEGLGHAWSGGSPEGTYTDPKGPDASREILRFLLSHHR